MDYQRLAAAAKSRYSCRRYRFEAPSGLEAMKTFLQKKLNPYADGKATFYLLDDPSAAATIIRWPVGRAPAVLLMAADTSSPYALETLGYMGEQAVLEATSLNLATCWMTGTYNKQAAQDAFPDLVGPWHVLAVSPLGICEESRTASLTERVLQVFGKAKKQRRPLDELLPPADAEALPPAAVNALLTAASQAPSAMNRQPWRFTVDSFDLCLHSRHPQPRSDNMTRLDCGILMLEFEIAAHSLSLFGHWTPENPDGNPIARYSFRQS